MLTVELLGPLRVTVAGLPVELPAGRLRELLAVLAMSAGRPVAVERLAATVWGTHDQRSRASLRTCIKRLRRSLEPAGSRLIVAGSRSYLLLVKPDDVDALHFDRLLDEAAATPDSATELSLLTGAMALWRGTPFAGIRSDWLEQSVLPALQERYLNAFERRVDLELAHSRPPDTVKLADLVDKHPLRESLWKRMLQVLQAAGRPAEALEQYGVIRRRLAEELGSDPSPELQQLHADLLAAGAPSTRNSAPRQLPTAVDGFAGRDAELAALDAQLGPPDAARRRSPLIAVIAGTAGVGKTSLALQWAHQIAGRFPDGQLYIDLRGYDPSGQPVRSHDAVRECLEAMQVPQHRIPDSPSARSGLYRSLLAGQRMLVLLDNALDADQVGPLLPGESGCVVVITSRNHLVELVTAHGAHPVSLDLMSPDQAKTLLAQRLGQDRIVAEPAAVDEILRRCSGLPLALAIVAARATIPPPQPLSRLAEDLRNILGALDRAVDVRAIFSWSYQALSGELATRLFRLVAGLHPGPESTAAAAASLAGVQLSKVRAAIGELVRANLLTERAPGRYGCHDLLRAYATELSEAHDRDREAACRRLVYHYVQSACDAARSLCRERGDIGPDAIPPGVFVADVSRPGAADAWFTAERPALLAILEVAAHLGMDRQVCHLARAMVIYLHRRGLWNDRVTTQRMALAAARRLRDPDEETRAARDLAWALADLGQFDEAQHSLNAALQLSTDNLNCRAWTHCYQALIHGLQGRAADAIEAAGITHDLFAQLGDEFGQAVALTDLGLHQSRLGNHDQALELSKQALAKHRNLGNSAHAAHAWSSLADTHLQLRDARQAIPAYQRALDLFRELADVFAEASTLAHLGASYYLADDRTTAGEYWQRARRALNGMGPYTADQIFDQLATIDGDAAGAMLRSVEPNAILWKVGLRSGRRVRRALEGPSERT